MPSPQDVFEGQSVTPAPRRPSSSTVPRRHRVRAERFARYSLILLVLITGVAFFNMIRIFIVPVILAAVFAGMFYPFYNRVVKLTRGQRAISALVCCILLLLGLVLPGYGIANLVAREAVHLYQTAESRVDEIWQADALERIQQYPFLQRLRLANMPLQAWIEQAATNAAGLLVKIVNRISRETFELIANVLIMFFTMFYFFRDGPVLVQRLKYFSPLAEHYEDYLIRRFLSVARATIKGTLLVAILKGVLGGLTFWAFGIEAAALWGVVMAFLAVLPIAGPWLVMCPAGVLLLLTGQIWQGVLMLIIALVIVSSIDNVLEPYVVGRDAGMHDLLVFFSMMGGIATFGVMGFIVGPILAALFRTLLDIYGIEFKRQLDLVHQPPPSETEFYQRPVTDRPEL